MLANGMNETNQPSASALAPAAKCFGPLVEEMGQANKTEGGFGDLWQFGVSKNTALYSGTHMHTMCLHA